MKNKNKILKLILPSALLLLPMKVFAQWNIDDPLYDQFNLPDASITKIVSGIVSWLFGILGLVALIGFMVAGIWYLTASGDETQIERAKRAMVYSIWGVVVGLMGFVILRAVTAMLSGLSNF